MLFIMLFYRVVAWHFQNECVRLQTNKKTNNRTHTQVGKSEREILHPWKIMSVPTYQYWSLLGVNRILEGDIETKLFWHFKLVKSISPNVMSIFIIRFHLLVLVWHPKMGLIYFASISVLLLLVEVVMEHVLYFTSNNHGIGGHLIILQVRNNFKNLLGTLSVSGY